MTIDGYTQPTASPNTLAKGTNAVLLVQLDGTNAGAIGLEIDADNVVVKGLVINRFARGVRVSNTSNATSNKLEGNFVGTDPSGTQALSNVFDGVSVLGANNVIGGTTPAARNLISGNDSFGVVLGSTGNKVEGNLIGTDANGTTALGNGSSGVLVLGGSDNTIGGTTAGAANTIAFNGDGVNPADGVDVRDSGSQVSTGNRVLRNSIFANEDLGIDLGGDGPTANDPKDPDPGPNNLQNKPVVTSATTTSGTTTTIVGKLNSTPITAITVQLFSNPPGTYEGKKFVGNKSVTTGADGKADFTKAINPAVPAGQTVTATATDPGGNTSEFSAPRTVVAQYRVVRGWGGASRRAPHGKMTCKGTSSAHARMMRS